MNSFKEDRLQNEKNDPSENSSLRFVLVPIILLSIFVGFGATYLFMRTGSTTINGGDSRTSPEKNRVQSAAVTDAGANATTEFDLAAFTQKGKQVFTTTCQACHQATGAGIPGAFPPLDGSEWVTGPSHQVAAIVLHGLQGEITVKGQKFQSVMPAFKDQLSDEDIAAVTTYVRQAWGNKAGPIMKSEVEKLRAETSGRGMPWVGGEELQKQKWE